MTLTGAILHGNCSFCWCFMSHIIVLLLKRNLKSRTCTCNGVFLLVWCRLTLNKFVWLLLPSLFTCFPFQIWDIHDQCCLFTADPKASAIHGDISACSYSSAMKSLYIAADCMAALSLKIRLAGTPLCFIHHRIKHTLKIFWKYSSTEPILGWRLVKF